jgi:hypothetical protein
MMDPDQLADVLAGRDAHLELDCPLAVVEAMRKLAVDRDNLRAEVARLTQRSATAELALLSMTARIERAAAADVFAFDGDLDDAGYFCAVGL